MKSFVFVTPHRNRGIDKLFTKQFFFIKAALSEPFHRGARCFIDSILTAFELLDSIVKAYRTMSSIKMSLLLFQVRINLS